MSSPSSSVEDDAKYKLASEQERACQIAELKAEAAKVKQVNTQVKTMLQQIVQKAGIVLAQMNSNGETFASFEQTLTNAEEHSAELLDDGVQNYLSRTCDDPFQLDSPVGYGNVRELSKQAAVALHLVAVLACARAKMQKVAKINYKVEEEY
ncbi:hypothetical protein IWZ00DRAFT_541449 [Phyllosticta capitalensis]|uniref:uncharacterized protein n=1 Tax=Phyllosticta capitalensis TaxID=121624 RepID=UPI00312EC942